MGLGTAKLHIKGQEQQFYATRENTKGQYTEAKTADSLNVLTSSFVPNVPRDDRMDSYMASRDIIERITKKSEHSWSMEAFYIPSGTKNVPCDCADLIRACGFTETIGTNDVSYAQNSSQDLETLTLTRFFQDLFMESLVGAWVEEMTISAMGGEEPKIRFSGGAMDYAATCYSATAGTHLIDATTLNVTSGEGPNFHSPKSTAIFARSSIGVGVSASGSVTAVADASGGDVTMTSTAHGLSVGDVITTTGFTDGNYNKAAATVTAVASVNTFAITATWGATDTGTFTTMETGAITAFADYGDSAHVTVTSNGHGLVNGQTVTITGTTNYNGTFNVEGSTANTFRIIDTWVADDGTGTWRADSYNVSARTADALTIAPGLASAPSAATDVLPIAPTHTDTGSPISGLKGSLTLDTLALSVMSFELTVKQNIKALADHAFMPHTDDIIPGFFEITAKVGIRMRQDFIKKLLKRQKDGTIDLAVVIGTVALSGTRLEIDAGYCEIDYSEVTVPESEEATVELPLRILGSAGNDAVTFKHT